MSVEPAKAIARAQEQTQEPPRTVSGILRALGPGLIIAGAIVGSGELIATTKVGAQGGISLLWLIIVGCLVKVFAQVELGRFAISQGETTLHALNRVPGPRLGVNWVMWMWIVMMVSTVGQLGGIVGGVGQAMALTFPVRGDYARVVSTPGRDEFQRLIELDRLNSASPVRVALRQRVERAGELGQHVYERLTHDPADKLLDSQTGLALLDPPTFDDRFWAGVVAVMTSVLLYFGRYGVIQNFATVLVATFTAITVGNVVALQLRPEFAISGKEILHGLMFHAPPAVGGMNPWVTALAAFGIIGVGATELITYPYWCLEKGYGSFVGTNDGSTAWVKRAQGWIRVMTCDAFASLLIYTIATLAFFLMGVAVLHRQGLDPSNMRMVSTLAETFAPVFGSYAKWLFLLGAIAVLYSTYLIASAGNARMITDGLRVGHLIDPENPQTYRRMLTAWSVGLPLLCFVIFTSGISPVTLIIVSGFMQAIMLVPLGLSAMYFRYRWVHPELRPGRLWDVCLGLSNVALLIAAVAGVHSTLASQGIYRLIASHF